MVVPLLTFLATPLADAQPAGLAVGLLGAANDVPVFCHSGDWVPQ